MSDSNQPATRGDLQALEERTVAKIADAVAQSEARMLREFGQSEERMIREFGQSEERMIRVDAHVADDTRHRVVRRKR